MIENRIVILCLIVAAICLQVKADDAKQDKPNRTTAEVAVSQSDELYEVYAHGYGCGYTLETAKTAAMNSIMPQLIQKTMNIGAMTSYMTSGGITTGKGFDQVAGKIMVQGYWELKDDIYQYTIELLIRNTDKKENAEKP